MTRSDLVWVAAGLAILCLSGRAMADVQADYKAVFGEEEKTVLSGGPRASADFAAKLLAAAKGVGEQKDLQAMLCEKAYDFGMKDPAGYATAIDAMKFLAEVAPDKKKQAQGKLLDASELRFTKSARVDRKRLGEELVDLLDAFGDEQAAAKCLPDALVLYRKALAVANGVGAARGGEIADKIKQTTSDIELEGRLADLKKRLKDNPKSVATRTSLILAYLGEADSPGEAVKILSDDLDEKLRTYVPLAARPVAELEEGACLELANWYLEVGEKTSPAGKGVLLGKGKACCQRYLELHTDQDVARLKATMLLEKIDTGMNKASPLSKRAAANLVLYYAFDEKADKVVDKSGRGIHGIVHGAAWTPNGKVGGAYRFSGGKDHILVDSPALRKSSADSFSLAVCFYVEQFNPNDLNAVVGISAPRGANDGAFAYGIGLGRPNGQGTDYAVVFSMGTHCRDNSVAPLMLGLKERTWYHVVGVYDKGDIRLYVNGSEKGRTRYSLGSTPASTALVGCVGNSYGQVDTRGFHGIIDEVMIFNCALSAEEVRRIYQHQSSKAP
ncbi:MAG: LamG domain-containing protein [Planctomycetota bacterium]|nr:LamG domain-containing protein [Planctomycetota bacterium]